MAYAYRQYTPHRKRLAQFCSYSDRLLTAKVEYTSRQSLDIRLVRVREGTGWFLCPSKLILTHPKESGKDIWAITLRRKISYYNLNGCHGEIP